MACASQVQPLGDIQMNLEADIEVLAEAFAADAAEQTHALCELVGEELSLVGGGASAEAAF